MDTGTVSIIIAGIGALGTIVVAIITASIKKSQTVLETKVDGRLTQLLEISIENSRREGAQEEQEKSKEVLALQNEMNIESAKLIGKLEGQKAEKDKQDQQTGSTLQSAQVDQPVKVEVVNAPLEVKSTDIKGTGKNKPE